jgi:hypothetical protein
MIRNLKFIGLNYHKKLFFTALERTVGKFQIVE